jgi:hypothetical protein
MTGTQFAKLAMELVASISTAILSASWVVLYLLRRKIHRDEVRKHYTGPGASPAA